MTDYAGYVKAMRRIADVRYACDVLQWDQEVYMPEGGARYRAGQIATLSGIQHEMQSDDSLGKLIDSLSRDESLSDMERRNIAESRRKYEEQKKYPNAFVVELQESVSKSFQAWQHAKRKNDFSLFSPHLESLIVLKRRECELLGYDDHPYDALLNLFEPGSTRKKLDVLFGEMRTGLVPIVQSISRQEKPDASFLTLRYDKEKQWAFGLYLLQNLHYDFKRGRQDISSHPFTTNFNADDVRITTRIDENDFSEMTWSTIHECGHALYEQGLPVEMYGLPAGDYLSLGIHESQSRLWENNVGRSRNFWEYHYPELQRRFPENLTAVSGDDFFRAINLVTPSPVRTQADEVTYHLHILIRYEIECGLLEGQFEVRALPGIWRDKYREYLGIEVPDDAHGILQDVHWSHGAFGYFPTYTQGSIYAAQFYEQAGIEIPGMENEIRKGNVTPLLQWLRKKIHSHGRTRRPDELSVELTGSPLDFSVFLNYIKTKYATIYNLDT